MTFEDLLDILAEQFSCDAAELSKDTSFEDLGVDAEDLVELAWQLGEATGTEVEEDRLKQLGTIGEVWNLVRELEEEAEAKKKEKLDAYYDELIEKIEKYEKSN